MRIFAEVGVCVQKAQIIGIALHFKRIERQFCAVMKLLQVVLQQVCQGFTAALDTNQYTPRGGQQLVGMLSHALQHSL